MERCQRCGSDGPLHFFKRIYGEKVCPNCEQLVQYEETCRRIDMDRSHLIIYQDDTFLVNSTQINQISQLDHYWDDRNMQDVDLNSDVDENEKHNKKRKLRNLFSYCIIF